MEQDIERSHPVSEETIQQNWPSALQGNLEHPEWENLMYWAGEQRGRVVARFRYQTQLEEESCIVFFIDVSKEGWVLRQLSQFMMTEKGLKLVKKQSFRTLDEMEQKYHKAIDLLIKARKEWPAL